MSFPRTLGLPRLQEGAARSMVSHLAWEADPHLLGLPSDLPGDWPRRFLEAFGRALRRRRGFRLFLEACVGCGACAGACPYHLGTGDPLNIPMARADLARRVYRAHFRPSRRLGLFPAGEAEALSPQVLADWYTYFHQCSLCRRCAVYCPLGIDTSEVTSACREILAAVGLAAAAPARGAANYYRYGNALGLRTTAWEDWCRSAEVELEQTTGLAMTCPVDEYRAEVLLIPAAADLTTHRGTFLGYAKFFHAVGVAWTTSTWVADGVNPGAYLDHRNLALIQRRVLEAARELKPRHIVWGETGSGWRVAANWGDTLDGPWRNQGFLEVKTPIHISEWAAHLLRHGALAGRLHPEANDRKVVTYHDPCQAARSCGLTEEPRELLKAACNHLAELPRAVSRQRTLCCGGGGGLQGGELGDLRLAGFLPRARTLAELSHLRGCNWVATTCDQCKTSLRAGLDHFDLALTCGGVMELVGHALYPAWYQATAEESP